MTPLTEICGYVALIVIAPSVFLIGVLKNFYSEFRPSVGIGDDGDSL